MNKLLLVIIAILLPPLAVYLKSNSVKSTLINLVLCLFFWLPGLLHALWVVLK
ncbi:MAG: YqaE/Pmp3 family membrane protein [Verrucomicrobiota bacterium]